MSPLWASRTMILNQEVNLFCWERVVSPSIHHYLTDKLKEKIIPIKCSISTGNIESKFESIKRIWDDDLSSKGNAFWQEVLEITRDFLKLSVDGSGVLHIKIEDDNGCEKFHTDGYRL